MWQWCHYSPHRCPQAPARPKCATWTARSAPDLLQAASSVPTRIKSQGNDHPSDHLIALAFRPWNGETAVPGTNAWGGKARWGISNVLPSSRAVRRSETKAVERASAVPPPARATRVSANRELSSSQSILTNSTSPRMHRDPRSKAIARLTQSSNTP